MLCPHQTGAIDRREGVLTISNRAVFTDATRQNMGTAEVGCKRPTWTMHEETGQVDRYGTSLVLRHAYMQISPSGEEHLCRFEVENVRKQDSRRQSVGFGCRDWLVS